MASYVKKDRNKRLPLVTDAQINKFSGGASTQRGSYIYNGIVLQYPNGPYYVTQRPSVNIFEDPDSASTPVTANQGRAVYYWDQGNTGIYVASGYVAADYTSDSSLPALYFVNAGTVYKGTYDTACVGASMTTGTCRVYIKELNDKIVILDAENDQMFFIDDDDDDYLVSMQTYSSSAANDIWILTSDDSINTSGGMDFTGIGAGDTITLSGTTSNDGTYTVVTVTSTKITVSTNLTDEASSGTPIVASVTVATTNYSSLPQNQATAVALADGLAVLDKTLYVMDTNGVIYGCALNDAQDWTDALNFITAELEEDKGVFLAKHHNHIVALGQRTVEFFYDAANPTGSPLSSREDVSYNIGCADPKSVWVSDDTIFFLGKTSSGQKAVYKIQDFKIESISNSTLSTYFSQTGYNYLGSGFVSGNSKYYILTTSSLSGSEVAPIETNVYNTSTQTWTEWDYSGATTTNFPVISFTQTSNTGYGQFTTGELFTVADNYVPQDNGNTITMKIRLDNFDADSRDWKYAHQLRYVGDATEASANLTIKWSDDNNASYSAGRTIDISNSKNKLTRLGRFKSRSHEVSFASNEQVRMEAIDLEITEGTH